MSLNYALIAYADGNHGGYGLYFRLSVCLFVFPHAEANIPHIFQIQDPGLSMHFYHTTLYYRGICCRRVSFCPSVTSREFYQNG